MSNWETDADEWLRANDPEYLSLCEQLKPIDSQTGLPVKGRCLFWDAKEHVTEYEQKQQCESVHTASRRRRISGIPYYLEDEVGEQIGRLRETRAEAWRSVDALERPEIWATLGGFHRGMVKRMRGELSHDVNPGRRSLDLFNQEARVQLEIARHQIEAARLAEVKRLNGGTGLIWLLSLWGFVALLNAIVRAW